MKSHRIFALLIVMVLIFVTLSGCKRSIPGNPQEPAATTESAEALPTSEATDVLQQIYIFATQTAMVSQGMTTPAPGEGGTEAAQLTPGVMPSEVVMEEPTETPLPVVVAPTATPGLPTNYTLRQGEFPYCIARRYNIDPGALLRANNLTSYSVYYGGMELKIPQNAGKFPGSRALLPHPATYTVKSGDTFYTIACAFGDLDPEIIAYVNNMSVNEKPAAGTVLNIP
jgi:LysM repeat protein